jgi:large subunit ribosomal protein L22
VYDGPSDEARPAAVAPENMPAVPRKQAAVAPGAVHDRPREEVTPMSSKASARFSRISPRKARMIADLVRGRDAAEAIQLLQFTQKSGAPVLKKILESAVANARQGGADVDLLFVSKATVDKGPNKFFRRWRPRAMGRATRITKGISHIVIELEERT